ncbi:MAG: helix-turn-helix transcriptional regulator [Actinobacteria bacterium]|nr:helix-turn-helix transcriptional regulator [Actinomycetota bacterium]
MQLAEISGVEQTNISAIETGRRQPSASTLHQLLMSCGYEVVARAGDKIIPLPASPDDLPGDVAESPAVTADTDDRTRALMFAALVDLAAAMQRQD